jgi:hypothetical protein
VSAKYRSIAIMLHNTNFSIRERSADKSTDR